MLPLTLYMCLYIRREVIWIKGSQACTVLACTLKTKKAFLYYAGFTNTSLCVLMVVSNTKMNHEVTVSCNYALFSNTKVH